MRLSFLPSCDLIWLKDCLREEDWPKHQLGILSGDQLRRVLPCCSCIPASSRWSSSTNKANCFLFLTPQEGIHTVDIAASINPSRRLYVLSLQPLYTGESFHFILLLILAVLHENILCSAEKDSMRETPPCHLEDHGPFCCHILHNGPDSCAPDGHRTELVTL